MHSNSACQNLRQKHTFGRWCKSRVCHQLASPIMAWVPPSSCTSRIPKQHSLDPPVRGQIRNSHRKFPMMCEALFRPSVESMLLCECHCLSIFIFFSMMQNIMPRCVPFHKICHDGIENFESIPGGHIFLPRTFLLQDVGLELLWRAASRQRQRNDYLTGQSPG